MYLFHYNSITVLCDLNRISEARQTSFQNSNNNNADRRTNNLYHQRIVTWNRINFTAVAICLPLCLRYQFQRHTKAIKMNSSPLDLDFSFHCIFRNGGKLTEEYEMDERTQWAPLKIIQALTSSIKYNASSWIAMFVHHGIFPTNDMIENRPKMRV